MPATETVTGWYCFLAVYGGDTNFSGSSDGLGSDTAWRWETERQNPCQNSGPKWPVGLLSNPCSLGNEPPLPLPRTERSARTSVCETLALLLVIGSAF